MIVGAGQVTRRDGEDVTPLGLMVDAARAALEDAGAPGLAARLDSIAVTDCFSWPVPDPGRVLAAELGAEPRETVRSAIGGTGPIELLRDAGRRIAAGELDVALLAGGEAARSLLQGRYTGGPEQPAGSEPTRMVGKNRPQSHAAEEAAGLFLPIAYYPLFEHALRAAAGRGREEHAASLGRLWARLAAVAAGNPYAWATTTPDAETIATARPGNRLVADPYTKLMTANIYVDQGAALVVCSAEAARAAGIPPERWVFLTATAGAHDHWFAVERDALHRSPAIAACGRAALGHAGAGIDDVAHLDLYSCFPCAVEIAAAELGLDLENDPRPPTVTGGLTFAGGPASNYPMHSLAALTGRLRADGAGHGLATGVGWFMTKHATAILSATPPARPFGDFDVQAEVDALPRREAAGADAAASAPVESYTVVYDATGAPSTAIVSALLDDGRRALARSDDPDTMAALRDEDPIGTRVRLDGARFALAS